MVHSYIKCLHVLSRVEVCTEEILLVGQSALCHLSLTVSSLVD